MEMRGMNVDNDQMFIFSAGEGMVGGALFQLEGFIPSKDGVRLYFDGDPDISLFLNRVESLGGEVLKPKTVITKEISYCAHFMDTEGNIVFLHSRG